LLTRPTEAEIRALAYLQHPNFEALRLWLENSVRHTVDQIAEAEPGFVLARLQGEARQLKELLRMIAEAQVIAQKMHQK
jgi:hypothetical protein